MVYRFEKGKDIDLNKAEAIQAVTYTPSFALPADGKEATYVVTVLDRVNNESPKGSAVTVK